MELTAAEPRRRGLVQLYIDGEPAVKIDHEVFLRSRLKPGDELTDEELGWIIRQLGEAMARRYPLEPPRPHRFSWRFRLRMERLCRRAEQEEARPIPAAGGEGAAGCPRPRQGHRLSPRMLAAAVLAAVLCSTAAMASMRYFRLVREEHPKYSTIRYEQLEEGYRPGEFVAYHLAYLPEGF